MVSRKTRNPAQRIGPDTRAFPAESVRSRLDGKRSDGARIAPLELRLKDILRFALIQGHCSRHHLHARIVGCPPKCPDHGIGYRAGSVAIAQAKLRLFLRPVSPARSINCNSATRSSPRVLRRTTMTMP
jgi:hypothetical protein